MSNANCPPAFFDTLEEMPNPFKQPVTSLKHLSLDASQDAVDDYQYAAEFIFSYRGSPDTFSTYRREIEHFLHWCLIIAKKNLKQIVKIFITENKKRKSQIIRMLGDNYQSRCVLIPMSEFLNLWRKVEIKTKDTKTK